MKEIRIYLMILINQQVEKLFYSHRITWYQSFDSNNLFIMTFIYSIGSNCQKNIKRYAAEGEKGCAKSICDLGSIQGPKEYQVQGPLFLLNPVSNFRTYAFGFAT
ncbi:hypothetical protein V8G54_020359 [Vigna mungo]|uniref:Uncharacterized protein n=1 Tax=Vigna mungo TaxID=3915 RepID=A0AAQ3NFB7_VIGMU